MALILAEYAIIETLGFRKRKYYDPEDVIEITIRVKADSSQTTHFRAHRNGLL